MTSGVALADIETTLGRLISDPLEQSQVEQWISDAELLIQTKLGDLDALNQDVLAYVVREAVAGKTRNPEGYQSETVDDYTYRWADAGSVAIRDEWWDMLNPATEAAAYSFRPTFEPDAAQWAARNGTQFTVDAYGWPVP